LRYIGKNQSKIPEKLRKTFGLWLFAYKNRPKILYGKKLVANTVKNRKMTVLGSDFFIYAAVQLNMLRIFLFDGHPGYRKECGTSPLQADFPELLPHSSAHRIVFKKVQKKSKKIF